MVSFCFLMLHDKMQSTFFIAVKPPVPFFCFSYSPQSCTLKAFLSNYNFSKLLFSEFTFFHGLGPSTKCKQFYVIYCPYVWVNRSCIFSLSSWELKSGEFSIRMAVLTSCISQQFWINLKSCIRCDTVATVRGLNDRLERSRKLVFLYSQLHRKCY